MIDPSSRDQFLAFVRNNLPRYPAARKSVANGQNTILGLVELPNGKKGHVIRTVSEYNTVRYLIVFRDQWGRSLSVAKATPNSKWKWVGDNQCDGWHVDKGDIDNEQSFYDIIRGETIHSREVRQGHQQATPELLGASWTGDWWCPGTEVADGNTT